MPESGRASLYSVKVIKMSRLANDHLLIRYAMAALVTIFILHSITVTRVMAMNHLHYLYQWRSDKGGGNRVPICCIFYR